MEGQDKLRSFYDKIKSNPNVTGLPDDYEVFKSALSDTNKAKGFYDTLKKGGAITGLPDDFSGFSSILPEPAENTEKTDAGKKKGFWDTYAGDLIEKVGAGAVTFGGSMYSALDHVNNSVMKPWTLSEHQDSLDREKYPELAKTLDELSVPVSDRGLTNGKSKLKVWAENAHDDAGNFRERAVRNEGKDFKELWKNGDYSGAVGDVFLQASESLPQSLMAMFGGGAGLALTGVSAGTNKYDVIDKDPDTKDLPEYRKVINAVATGTFEALTERLGDVPIGNWLKGLYSKAGREVAEQTVSSGFERFLKNGFKKYGVLVAPVAEGVEEIAAQISENATDYCTGVSKLDLMRGVPESFVYGMGGGMQFSAVALPGLAMRKIERRKTNRDYRKAREVLEQVFPDSNVDAFEEGLSGMSQDDQREILGNMMNNPDLNDEQKAIVTDFFLKANKHQAYNSPEAKAEDDAWRLLEEKVNKKSGDIVTAKDVDDNPVYVLDETDRGFLVEYQNGEKKFVAAAEVQGLSHEPIAEHVKKYIDTLTLSQGKENRIPKVGDDVFYNGERARVQRVDDDGTVIEVGDNRVEKVPSGALQFDEGTQREAQAADPDTVASETPVTDVSTDTPVQEIPQTQKGKPDYNAMLESDPELFASEWEKRSTPESTRVALEKQSVNIGRKVESLLKNLEKESDFNRIAENEDEIARLKGQKERVDGVLAERYAVREEEEVVTEHRENSEHPVFSNEEEAVRWVAENSEDVGEILGTYEVVRGMKDEGLRNAPRWQQELLGKKIKPKSFYENGDRNSVTPIFRNGWLSKNGRGIDELAQELSGYGVEVTNQNVVDFMLEHPNGKVRRNSEEIDVLGQRFSEVASQVSGMKIGRPDSPTGKLFIEKLKTSENVEQLKQQIESAQQAENEVLKSIAEQHEAEQQNDPYRTLTDEEVDVVMSRMQEDAVEAPILELTPDNWTNEFGDNGVIDTPIGKVKMGENQYLKFAKLGRDSQLGMVKPTLTNPDVVIEDKSGGVDSERNSSYVYVKTFTDKSGKKHTYFTSVTVLKEGMEVSVSSHIKNKNRIKSLLKEGNLLWNRFGFDSDASGEYQDYTTVTALNPSDNERGTTSQSKLLSENKDTEVSGEKQAGDTDVHFRNVGDIEGINQRFNDELQQQITGTLPKGHVYQIGRPSSVLLSAGIPNLPIELSAERLLAKASKEYDSNHPFDLKNIENLPEALNHPIAVFDARKKNGGKVVLTELKQGDNNFVVALHVRKSDDSRKIDVEVNSVRSLYPKDRSNGILDWINGGLMNWVDKEKAFNFFSTQWPNYIASGGNTESSEVLSSATNILQNFQNPSIEDGEISAEIDNMSDALGVKVNKVQSRDDLPEGMRRGMKGGHYPGLFDPKSGKVYVVLNEIENVADAQATVLHEVIGHKGIRGLFGERLPEFCERVLASLPEGKRVKLLEKYEGNGQLAAEEYVAGFAEEYSDPSGWEKVKAIVKEFLRDLTGIDLKLSDNDLKYILWKAKNGLKEGGMMSAIEGVVRDNRVQDVLFRQQHPDLRTAEEFIKEKRSGLEATKERFVDSAVAVKELTDFLKGRGIKIRDFEDAYSESLLSDSKSYHAINRYQEQYQQPLNEAIAALRSKGRELRDVYHYLIAKHASERNREIGNREYEKWLDGKHRDLLAEKKKFEFFKKNGKKDDAEYDKKLKAFEEGVARSNRKFEEERAVKEVEFRSRIYAGMSDEDAAVIVRDFEAGCSKEEISNLWEKIRAATNFAIERQFKDGLIPKESYESMRGTYEYYIPLKGWEETDGVDYSASERYHTPANVSKLVEARGRVSMADNPVAYIEMAAEAAIVEGNRNYVRQCLYNLCVNNPDEGLYSVNRTYYVEKDGEWIAQTEKPAKELFENGTAKTVLTDKPYKALVSDANAQRYDVTVFVNGEKNTISFAQGSKGLDIADAINRTRMWKPGRVSQAFGHVTRFLSAQNTSRNPEFIIRNFERDFLYAVPAYAIKGGNSIKLIANLRPAFKALHREFMEGGAKQDSELNRYMDEFLNAGGKTGFVHSLDMESRKRKSEREIRRIINRDSAGGRARAVGKAIGSTMEYLSDISENSIRFAVFLTERQAGKGVKEAAIAAKEITVNFNRKGTVTPAMSQYFAFFNAGVQGSLHNFLGLGLKWGNRFLVANAALGAIQMVAAQLSRCFGDDDELGVSDYDRLSDYTRNNNIILPDVMRISELFDVGKNEEARKYGFMTIPMPQSFRAVSAVGIITDQVLRERKSPSDGITDIVDNILANMSPLDLETYNFTNGKPWMFFLRALPTAMQPVVDLMTNKNFMESDVFREPFAKNMEGMIPQSSLGMKNTNLLLVSMSKGLNRWANGTTDINPELQTDAATGDVSRNKMMSYVDINPAKVEHIIEGITGGAGKFVNNFFKTASSLVTGGELESRDIPFVRTHRTMPYRQTHWEMFFEARESVADVDFVANTHKKNRNFGIYTKILTNGGQLMNSTSYECIDKLVRGFREVAATATTEESKKNWTEIIDRTVLNWAKGQKQIYDEAIKDDDKKKKQ